MNYKQLAAGARTSYALLPNGQSLAWGSNEFNELGNGIDGYHNFMTPEWPASVIQETAFRTIAAGGSRAAAIDSGGGLWSWGDHQNGRLGLGQDHHVSVVLAPRRIAGLTRVTAVALGERAGYAIDGSGNVWEWGDLGRAMGNLRCAHTPQLVVGINNVVSVKASHIAAFALKDDGTVWMWGDRSAMVWREDPHIGPAYFMEIAESPFPVQLRGLPPVRQIVAGWKSLIALAEDGSLWDFPLQNNARQGASGSDWAFEYGPTELSHDFGGTIQEIDGYGDTFYATVLS